MRGLSLENIIAASGGEYFGDSALLSKEVTAITSDSRKVEPGCLFAAIPGERVDGHDFIPAVMAAGALCSIGEKLPEENIRPFIRVPNTIEALQSIAEFYRREFDIPFVGITGSVGKTTAKEMVASVLSQHYNVHKTAGNFNNELGVPLTLFGLREEHTAAVIEMGISHFGEMSLLTKIVKPNYGLFTVIGHAHLEFLGVRRGVLKAKGEMVEGINAEGKIFCCGDDDLLSEADFGREKICYGLGENCLVRAENIRTTDDGSTLCTVVKGERRFDVSINAYGEHMISAALAGAAVGMELGLSDEEIARGIAAYEPVGARARLIKTDFLSIIDDCYNSNPTSLASSLRSLASVEGRKVAILGDMFELGENGEQLHFECGKYALELGVDKLLCCGGLSAATARGAGEIAKHFESKESLIAALSQEIEKGDTVLVKASRGMKFEDISAALKELK
ncbi:MAG: UDP-N-acetylmuramoyl-tripeptide--D-alanyl-D-alanine ligase [Oscillospiraceae bacterium]|nr:UDP-N-acetylmuramoyl-tripeptide--D-alanyl-D-alanine ligase [Oscillospiraceae bacterium]